MVPTPFYALKMGILTAMLTGLCASGYAGAYAVFAAPTEPQNTNYTTRPTPTAEATATPDNNQEIIIDTRSVGSVVVPTPAPTPTPTPTPVPSVTPAQPQPQQRAAQEPQNNTPTWTAPERPQENTQSNTQAEESAEQAEGSLNQGKSGIQRSGEVQEEEKHALEYNGTVSENGW